MLPEPSRRVDDFWDGRRCDRLLIDPYHGLWLWIAIFLVKLPDGQIVDLFARQLEEQIAEMDIWGMSAISRGTPLGVTDLREQCPDDVRGPLPLPAGQRVI